MICSLNELIALMRKAASGGGLSPGHAVEASEASAWLYRHGHDGLTALLDATGPNRPRPTPPQAEPDGYTFAYGSAGICGPAAMDLLVASTDPVVVKLTNVDAPWLICGYAGLAAEEHGLVFTITCATTTTSSTVSVSPDGIRADGPLGTNLDMTLTCAPANGRPAPKADPVGITIEPSLWDLAQQRAALTLVPATEASRLSGAGAGTTDND